MSCLFLPKARAQCFSEEAQGAYGSKMQRLLIVEDHSQFAESLKAAVKDSFSIEICTSVEAAIRGLHAQHYDVLLCDYILGSNSGLDLVEHAKSLVTPPRIVMMTAFAEKDMAIKALNLGVSRLLVKPFSLKELRACLFGTEEVRETMVSSVKFCPVTSTVVWQGESIRLTPSEYLILSYMASLKGKWVSRAQLEELLWNDTPHVSRNILDTHLYNLRKKVPVLNQKLSVVRGRGFLLNPL